MSRLIPLEALSEALVAQRLAVLRGDGPALEAAHERVEAAIAALSASAAPTDDDPRQVAAAAERVRARARESARALVRARDLLDALTLDLARAGPTGALDRRV